MKFKDFIQTDVGSVYKNVRFKDVGEPLVKALIAAIDGFSLIEEKADTLNRLMLLNYSATRLANNYLLVTKGKGENLQEDIEFLANRFNADFCHNDVKKLHRLLQEEKPTDLEYIGRDILFWRPLITIKLLKDQYGNTREEVLTSSPNLQQ